MPKIEEGYGSSRSSGSFSVTGSLGAGEVMSISGVGSALTIGGGSGMWGSSGPIGNPGVRGYTLQSLEKELEEMREFLCGETEISKTRYSLMDVPTFFEISEGTDIPMEEIMKRIVEEPMPRVVEWLLERVRQRLRSERIGI